MKEILQGNQLVGPDGQVLAVVAGDRLEPTAQLVSALDAYTEAQALFTLADMDARGYENNVRRALMEEPGYRDAIRRRDEAAATMAEIEDTLSQALANRPPGTRISIDTPQVLVTWGVARTTYTLAHPASWYASRAARRELADRLTAATERHKGSSPADLAAALVEVVMEWLAPTATVGENPGVRITVRPPSE